MAGVACPKESPFKYSFMRLTWFTSVREVRNTQPMLGSIRGSEHQEDGSFLFFRKTPGIEMPAQERQAARPGTAPYAPGAAPAKDSNAQLWTVGASLGSAFSAPWLIGTVRGTIAPLPYSFLELGFDAGLVSGAVGVSYFSIYPYAHYALYLPFDLPLGRQGISGGWYIGAGGGYIAGEVDYRGDAVALGYFAASATTGLNISGFLDISYSIHTNFTGVGNKFSVGYCYRFE